MRALWVIALLFLVYMNAQAQSPEEILSREGITLPALPKALGQYTNMVRSGNLIYLSGRGPLQPDGTYVTGKLGIDVDIPQGYAAARLCAIAQIAVLKAALGDLSKIRQIIKVTGYVNCTDNFANQPKVLDGYSDLIAEVFGIKGLHARSAVGISSLPGNWTVEVEMIAEIAP